MRCFCLLAATAVLVAGCSQREEPKQAAEDLRTFDVTEAPPGTPAPPPPAPISRSANMSADGGGPDINVSAAPGVAFNYRYAYRVPDARIQAAQEAHAAMCERLTITRCRITGMRYTVSGEDDVRASLEVKLDPRIARAFGKQATKVITDAEGMLVDQEISGTDVNPTISQADRSRAELTDELERVNRELARPGLSNVIRDRLLSEAQSLRAQIRALGEQRRSAEDSLATTPMAFFYGSGEAIPGFDDGPSLGDSFREAGAVLVGSLGALIVTLATLLPWLLLIALVWLLLRRLGLFRWSEARGYRPPADAEATAAAG
uniref:DUF4349 domain-containing protein n=1 Tax=uncultured Sphingomonas sp. TaxID=158754 RepID=UPI0025E68820|nr:DUF4349 domain-containing protein [uncultured Sphingomonas sp.]